MTALDRWDERDRVLRGLKGEPHSSSNFWPAWVVFGHLWSAISQTVIVADPVQISQIRYGKSIISQTLIVSDPVQISQIRYGKSTISKS